MKTLIVVRHAKSSWALTGKKDFDRPLNERGKKDAPEMAGRVLKAGVKIDLFVTSPAKRARKTCKAFAEAYGTNHDDIIFAERLYNAPRSAFYETIQGLANEHQTAALFAHNPGITDFVNALCKEVHIDNMPTCGVFAVKAEADSWKDFEDAEKQFLFFKYPKEI